MISVKNKKVFDFQKRNWKSFFIYKGNIFRMALKKSIKIEFVPFFSRRKIMKYI